MEAARKVTTMALLEPVLISELPKSIDDFLAQQESCAHEPQGGAAMLVVALLLYASDEALGRQCLAAAVEQEQLQEGLEGWELAQQDLQRVQIQIGKQPYLPHSYIRGATPENGYALPAPPLKIVCSSNPYSGQADSGRFKVFVACSGAATPRPVTVVRDAEGVWKAREWSSLVVGVQSPQ